MLQAMSPLPRHPSRRHHARPRRHHHHHHRHRHRRRCHQPVTRRLSRGAPGSRCRSMDTRTVSCSAEATSACARRLCTRCSAAGRGGWPRTRWAAMWRTPQLPRTRTPGPWCSRLFSGPSRPGSAPRLARRRQVRLHRQNHHHRHRHRHRHRSSSTSSSSSSTQHHSLCPRHSSHLHPLLHHPRHRHRHYPRHRHRHRHRQQRHRHSRLRRRQICGSFSGLGTRWG
jgi:hypothetical protein